jgi:hypothetical protein
MAETHRQKQQITAALTEVRIQVQNESSHLRHKPQFETTHPGVNQKYPWEWASCAAIFGWLLSGLPARKKRIYIHRSSEKPPKDVPMGHSSSFGEKFGKSLNP